MARLRVLKAEFLKRIADSRALFRHCLTPRAAHSDAGVEAAFLEMFKEWEELLEGCTLAFMCGRLRCDLASIAGRVVAVDEEAARNVLYQERAYAEWTNIESVFVRWLALFGAGNALESAVKPAQSDLKQMATVRNAIAHRSPAAVDKFKRLVQGQVGGRPRLGRPAAFLATAYPADPTRTFFDRYADVIEVAGQRLTG